ncbi:MAG: hypothetical protein AB3X44_02265 [Leptothrix sp. (in: b-proteobacteria)]
MLTKRRQYAQNSQKRFVDVRESGPARWLTLVSSALCMMGGSTVGAGIAHGGQQSG